MWGRPDPRYGAWITGLVFVALAVMVRMVFAPPALPTVVINEVLTLNRGGLADEDGDSSDWIELYNPTPEAVALLGYRLSDDPEEPAKWTFPDVTIRPGEHLIVHASRKGRLFLGPERGRERLVVSFESAGAEDGGHARILVNNTDRSPDRPGLNVVRLSGEGEYLEADAFDTGALVGAADRLVDFLRGLAPGDIVILAVAGDAARHLTHGARRAIEKLGSRHLELLDADDSWGMIGVVGQGRIVESYTASGYGTARNATADSTQLHAGFKLRGSGEFVGLYAPDGATVDSVRLLNQTRNVSFGRHPDGASEWCYFATPTPHGFNAPFCTKVTGTPAVSPGSDFDAEPVTVAIDAPRMATVHYTLDGSVPGRESPVYAEPLTIARTTVLRTRAFRQGFVPSPIVTRSYFIDEDVDMPVVSLVTDPENLWDERTGIYVEGPDPENPNYEQHGKKWERPAHVEFFEADGTPGFAAPAGVRVFGGAVREYPKKALVLYFRDMYGQPVFSYPVFPGLEVDRFRNLILRNGGDDGQYDFPRMRDGIMHALWAQDGGDVSARRPVFLYLNGAPWGIYNLRERIDRGYAAAHYGTTDVDLIRGRDTIVAGDDEAWERTFSFFEDNDLRQGDHFAQARRLIDVENFTDFEIFQIYAGNIDLEEANLFKVRPRTPDAKWRWILWDVDVAFGLVEESPVTHESLAWFTRDRAMPGLSFEGDDGGETLWATLPLRKLLQVDRYRDSFISRFADLLNTTLGADNVIAEINSQSMDIMLDIGYDIEIWKDRWFGDYRSSFAGWTERIEQLREFARLRPDVLRGQIRRKFSLPGTASVTVEPPSWGKGFVRVNTTALDEFPWTGTFFLGIPITLEAIPQPGYAFTGWGHPTLPGSRTVTTTLRGDLRVRPRFVLMPR